MLNSSMPRTAPTCQSRLGLSGGLLWQLTQAAPMMIGVAKRTRHARMRILPQAFQRLPLELVEGMRRAVLEGIIREKAELRIAVVSVDQVAELEREGGRNRNGARDLRVIGEHVCVLAVGEHAADHV